MNRLEAGGAGIAVELGHGLDRLALVVTEACVFVRVDQAHRALGVLARDREQNLTASAAATRHGNGDRFDVVPGEHVGELLVVGRLELAQDREVGHWRISKGRKGFVGSLS